jgi:large subunit ribosomal protein L24
MTMQSKKPSKQRQMVRNAPLHMRHRMLSVHLSGNLRKQLGKRSLPVRKGDEVKVLRGEHRGTTGKVEDVNLKSLQVFIENVKVKKVSGKEAAIPFRSSNLMITNLVLEDKERRKTAERIPPAKQPRPTDKK